MPARVTGAGTTFGRTGPFTAKPAIKMVLVIDSCCSLADDGPFSPVSSIPVIERTVKQHSGCGG